MRVEELALPDGRALRVVVAEPPGLGDGAARQVVLALPPGGQDEEELTLRIARATWAPEALRRGSVVVAPIAPGALFFEGSEQLLPPLMDAMAARYRPPGGRFVLVGVSNGGPSAFRTAGMEPGRFSALLADPGHAGDARDVAGLPALAGIPVRLFAGAHDAGWLAGEQAAALGAAGGDVTVEPVAGEAPIIGALGDGARIFATLDAALAGR